MSLDINKAALQLFNASSLLQKQYSDNTKALDTAVKAFNEENPNSLEKRRLQSKTTWLIPQIPTLINLSKSPDGLLSNHIVAAVDGSHIDIDRHSSIQCYLINIGSALIKYGAESSASLRNSPLFCAEQSALNIINPKGIGELPIKGALMGLTRTIMEIEALADIVDECPQNVPILALLDGSLILWGLEGFPEYIKSEFIEKRMFTAMERLRKASDQRVFAVASHISFPGSSEVVNAMRISSSICGWDTVNCDSNCRELAKGLRNCESLANIKDSDLFRRILGVNERSSVFSSTSKIVLDYYGENKIRFFYVNIGSEIVRLEIPEWTSSEGIEFAHSCIISQTAKGNGYPLALQEANEQAVINGSDRTTFDHLLYENLSSLSLPTSTSQKSKSKRTRFI